MLNKEMSKAEIEKELKNQGDYVQIDNITRFLKQGIPLDLKKFVMLKLVEIYERRAMFQAAADTYNKLAEIALISSEKTNYIVNEIKAYIKAGLYDKADITLKKLTNEISTNERTKILDSIKEFYKIQAENYEKQERRSKALQTYEKMMTMDYSELEKKQIQYKLLDLYKKLGMIKEYMLIEKKLKE